MLYRSVHSRCVVTPINAWIHTLSAGFKGIITLPVAFYDFCDVKTYLIHTEYTRNERCYFFVFHTTTPSEEIESRRKAGFDSQTFLQKFVYFLCVSLDKNLYAFRIKSKCF